MSTAVATVNGASAPITPIEQALVMNDLSSLSPTDRLAYYRDTCASLGLNHLTQPFGYLNLSGKLTLYARKEAADQLRSLRRVSVRIVDRAVVGDVYIVTAEATMPDGRTDSSTGVVTITGLKGDALANAYMKAETKAKRRVTLSICGLGFLDESEVATIPGARVIDVDAGQPRLTTPADPNAEPRPDAELSRFMEDDTPVWRVWGVECVRSADGKYLVSLDPCPKHDEPFAITLKAEDADWRHGKGENRCHLADQR